MLDDEPGRLGAETTAAAGGSDEGAEVARLILLVPLVRHDLPDECSAGVVDDRQDQPVVGDGRGGQPDWVTSLRAWLFGRADGAQPGTEGKN